MSHAESKDLNENEKMPRWVPRAILLFWAGFIATLVVRELFHQLTNFLILLLISLFFALAIEPAVNRLAARGWSRGSATTLMLLSVFVAIVHLVQPSALWSQLRRKTCSTTAINMSPTQSNLSTTPLTHQLIRKIGLSRSATRMVQCKTFLKISKIEWLTSRLAH